MPCENPKFFCWWRSNIKASRQQINKTILLYSTLLVFVAIASAAHDSAPWFTTTLQGVIQIGFYDHFGLESMFSQTSAMRTPISSVRIFQPQRPISEG